MLNYAIYRNKESKQWVTFIHGAGGSSTICLSKLKRRFFNYCLLICEVMENQTPHARFNQ